MDSSSAAPSPNETDALRGGDVITVARDLAIIAQAAALAVSPYLRKVARHVTSFTLKADIHDPVTEHDRRVEHALHLLLGFMVPGSRVLGEEVGEVVMPNKPERFTSDFTEHFVTPTTAEVEGARRRCSSLGERVRWIVDPIDGTANFVAGMAWFNTSIAAELDGVVVAGAINAPLLGETYVADATKCWRTSIEGSFELHATGPKREKDSILITYHPGVTMLDAHPEESFQHEKMLAHAYQTVRRPGAAALDLCMVAAGWVGAMLGTSFKPWDVAAGLHLIKVAGGRVVNLPLETDLPEGLRPLVVVSSRDLEPVTALRVAHDIQAFSDQSE